MNTSGAMNDLCGTYGTRVSRSRRATFMLAVAGIVSAVTQSRRARAEVTMSEKDGTTSAANPGSAGGLRSPKVASASQFRNLKALGPQRQVIAIYHCHDAFEVMTADGRSTVFQTTNLRFKIDSSDKGPPNGRPVILSGGMMGDRATVFFASPAEVSTLIKHRS